MDYRLLLVAAVVTVAGCTFNSANTVIGNNTQVSYGENVEFSKARAAQESLAAIGWQGNASLRKVNSTWYRIEMNATEIPEKGRNMPGDYNLQLTMSRMQAGEFSPQDRIRLEVRHPRENTLKTSIRR